ncbi:uncharacterized protein PRCAT00001384001 [Priceomyces carsonii]|uniref:uncharacterized protein n=1 Tax=Priceomyces carsonii TaxID=28549 RepID=UPI002ED98B6D|nr:unnamed protein product [Priceomyces carsonii]
MEKNELDVHVSQNNVALEAMVSQSGNQLSQNKQEVDLNAITSNPISLGEVGKQFSMEEKHMILRRLDMDTLDDDSDLPVTATFMIEQIQGLSLEESIKIMKETLVEHEGDINFSSELENHFRKLIAISDGQTGDSLPIDSNANSKEAFVETVKEKSSGTGSSSSLAESLTDYESYDWKFQARVEAGLVAFWSPYQEVRAVTTPFDDPNEPCETLRAYMVAIVWQAIGTFINTYFYARQPSISFTADIGQVFIYPCGEAWSKIMPDWTIPLPKGYLIPINKGPWTEKEQMFTSLIYFVAGLANNIYKIIFVQKSKQYLYTSWADWGYELLLGISSSFMGLV